MLSVEHLPSKVAIASPSQGCTVQFVAVGYGNVACFFFIHVIQIKGAQTDTCLTSWLTCY